MKILTLAFLSVPLLLVDSHHLTRALTRQSFSQKSHSSTALIEPGKSVGQLLLGESHEAVLEIFPFKKGVDQEWPEGPDCGTVINWVDSNSKGNVFVRLKAGEVAQIDSGTPRFHTSEGITLYSSPRAVRTHYKGLRAFVLSNVYSEATGGRPLTYWIDRKRGIAFAFAYYPREQRRYLYRIVVFKPNTEVCPSEGGGESGKHELDPYALEPGEALK
jgi:hypothetical protein